MSDESGDGRHYMLRRLQKFVGFLPQFEFESDADFNERLERHIRFLIPSHSRLEFLKKTYPILDSMYIKGNRQDLCQMGTYLLTKWKGDYHHLQASEIIHSHFSKDENEKDSWFDLDSNFVIVSYWLHSEDHSYKESLINDLFVSRFTKGKITIVLTEKDLDHVESAYRDCGKDIVNLDAEGMKQSVEKEP